MTKNILKYFLTCAYMALLSANISAQNICKRSHIIEAEKRSAELKMNFRKSAEKEYNYDVVYHSIYWKIDPDVYYISGRVATWFKPNEAVFTKIAFDLNSALTVDSIIYQGQKIPFNHQPNHKLITDLNNVVPQGVLDSLSIYYHGIPQSPERAFVREVHTGTPIIWTLSEPYGALDWWPCKQSLDDKIDSLDIFVQTPKPNKVGSIGILASTMDLGTEAVYHWKHRYPCAAYLVAIAVTNYDEFTDYAHTTPTDSFPIVNYVYPEFISIFREPAKRTVDVMELYIKLFGRYPFDNEKYGHAQFGFNGGMEHQTMSFMRNMDLYLIAHELGHQWFGDKVTCGSWKDIWLNEGFATYTEALVTEAFMSPSAWLRWKQEEKNNALRPEGSVKVDDTTNSSRIFSGALTYSKGGMLVHMLRFVMGDSAFFKGVYNYLHAPELAYGFAQTADLQRYLEAAHGKSLDWFFNDWYEGQGYPVYDLRYRKNANELEITLTQTPTHASVDFFDMPVPVRVWSKGKDTNLVLQPMQLQQTFTINLPAGFTIDSLQADPDIWLLANFTVYDLGKIDELDDFTIYPNPANNKITVKLPQKSLYPGEISIYDAMGKRLAYMHNLKNTSVDIDITTLAKGIYIMRYTTPDIIVNKKFMKGTEK